VGLLGRNGAGKSTLVKCLAGLLAPLRGRRLEGRHLRIGYFAQHHLEQLRPDESPLQHLIRLDPRAGEQELRDYLGGFAFSGDQASAACGRFSGGEKARLALALLIRRRPNLLLLDEPTNHLDLEMREALTLALQEYEGAVLLVSHDRHLLRTTADTFLLVAEGRVVPFDGDLDDYAAWLAGRQQQEATAGGDPDKALRKEARQAEKADRQARLAQRRPLLKGIAALERDMADWGLELQEIERRLADPGFYAGHGAAELERLARQRSSLSDRLAEAETRWLEAQAELESLDGE
jgi:ATP-binding cassette subfamily F protein 3